MLSVMFVCRLIFVNVVVLVNTRQMVFTFDLCQILPYRSFYNLLYGLGFEY